MMPILHSTKNLHVIEAPTSAGTGIGIFEYTDHYTVFHYGRMPDLIPGKGEASCRMAVFNFALLEAAGVPTHFRRFLPPNRIEFDLARLPPPDPERLTPENGNYLVPVQTLLRNEIPQGSSIRRRLASGALTPAQLGLTAVPTAGEELAHPILEHATMLEPVNRFVDRAQAQHLSGLGRQQFQQMRESALAVNEVLSVHARECGLKYADGKLEFLISNAGELILADSPGTPDESRLLFGGVHCGKQILRNWYVDNGLDVPVSRLIAEGLPRSRWPEPATLPPDFVPVMSQMYRSLSQTWTGENRWNAPDLTWATRDLCQVIGQGSTP